MGGSSRRALVTVLLAALAQLALPCSFATAQRSTTTLELDAIGPRSATRIDAVRVARAAELHRCRRDEDVLVRVALAIAPDGSVLDPRAVDGPDVDREATACVIAVLRGWSVPGRVASVTTISWSIRLHALDVDREDAAGDAALRTCWCSSWVHGADHGSTCEATRARCARERRATDRDATECVARRARSCEDEAWIDGQPVRPGR